MISHNARIILHKETSPVTLKANNVYEEISSNEDLKQNLGKEEYFHLEKNALVVKNAERHLMAQQVPELSSWKERVFYMEKTILRLLEKTNGERIVWVHNTQVGDTSATEMAKQGRVNIGKLLRKTQKDTFIL